MTKRFSRAVALGLFLAASAAASAHAAILHALTDGNTLIAINIEQRSAIGSLSVTGVQSQLVGIDVRPANGLLYGLFRNGVIATINTSTGQATQVSSIPALASGRHAVDFNPVADRLRVISENFGTNRRVDVTTGAVTVDGPITGPMVNPFGDTSIRVRQAAYINSRPGPAPLTTLLYDIDATPAALYLQLPPNDGTLVPVGEIGRGIGEFGFDIYQDSTGRNRGLIVSNSRLIEIDLAGGDAFSVLPIAPAGVTIVARDIAVLPNAQPH